MPLPCRVALGTMHGKEAAIAPPLATLGIVLERAAIDTDRFGTFSGDVARAGSIQDAARAKARAAARATGLVVAVASEGAYGPHPYLPFLPLGQEILLWLDTETGHEIIEMMTDDRPAYDQQIVTSAAEAGAFLSRAGFPAQALIVQTGPATAPLAKGITDRATLDAALAQALAQSGRAFLQTDMRAHMNPRRMAVIGQLAARLADRLRTPCPSCAAPGFGRLRMLPGLPCGDCGSETALIAADVDGCTACEYETVLPRAGAADPAHCPCCNP
jgi:hypothetical protein